MFFELPVELQREIYELDPTFRVLYRDAIRTLEYKYTHNNTRCYNPITGNHQYFHQDILIADCYYNKHHLLPTDRLSNHPILLSRWTAPRDSSLIPLRVFVKNVTSFVTASASRMRFFRYLDVPTNLGTVVPFPVLDDLDQKKRPAAPIDSLLPCVRVAQFLRRVRIHRLHRVFKHPVSENLAPDLMPIHHHKIFTMRTLDT